MAKQQPEAVMTRKRILTARTQEGFLYEKLSDKCSCRGNWLQRRTPLRVRWQPSWFRWTLREHVLPRLR